MLLIELLHELTCEHSKTCSHSESIHGDHVLHHDGHRHDNAPDELFRNLVFGFRDARYLHFIEILILSIIKKFLL